MTKLDPETLPPMPKEFEIGWYRGYYDGGEHDCRMFTPTAQRAWKDEWHRRQREKKDGQ